MKQCENLRRISDFTFICNEISFLNSMWSVWVRNWWWIEDGDHKRLWLLCLCCDQFVMCFVITTVMMLKQHIYNYNKHITWIECVPLLIKNFIALWLFLMCGGGDVMDLWSVCDCDVMDLWSVWRLHCVTCDHYHTRYHKQSIMVILTVVWDNTNK